MAVNLSLDGLKVLVTRPQHQATSLCESVVNEGGEAIVFPTIDIIPIEVSVSARLELDKQNIIIFVSRNAVELFGAALQARLASDVLAVAIGASTAQVMEERGFQPVIWPDAPAGSESVLALPELQDVKDKDILIVRGQEGRELLADTLIERGAITNYLEVYQRVLPMPTQQQLTHALLAECIIISSVNSLTNLCQLIGEENIKNKHLIVVSERIKQYAIGQGFEYINVAEGASDAALMQQIRKVGK